MSDASWSRELDLIRRGGASLAPGLAPGEFAAVEERFGFQFPLIRDRSSRPATRCFRCVRRTLSIAAGISAATWQTSLQGPGTSRDITVRYAEYGSGANS